MTHYADGYWTSEDGLELHYRDYPGRDRSSRDDRPPVLCLPGLTRTARDFEGLAAHLAGEWRLICPEMRGRGDSDYPKDAESYKVPAYIADITALLAKLEVDRFVAVGTSLGGIMVMAMAMTAPDRIAGAVLNDIGPFLDPPGMRQIQDYAAQGRSFPTWMHAARWLEEVHGHGYPDHDIADWLRMAKRQMVLSGNGRILLDFDIRIGEASAELDPERQPDVWAGIDALSDKPVLVLRGELSELLSAATVTSMLERMPLAEAVVVPRVGHPPSLDEPEALAAIDALLARIG
ncbi:alpha/beta hydrolase [Novosphingobium marinum]|uniref:Pimeloyl-ACP methyl ester carboxylesterase n=1 Tax=Novosphingobium marinum TaxID=1514948 RepID=A0A7Y9XXG5_9SPHN|nr:alpha/beta hydrolase [Novosphingobium marinum]NYH95175.1 pimeloyl-ACP methyl ester carboxylesterase [Novosphingobium marinum]GGC24915.1 alpha/beta hydrolase [Novosphingobium marinum]